MAKDVYIHVYAYVSIYVHVYIYIGDMLFSSDLYTCACVSLGNARCLCVCSPSSKSFSGVFMYFLVRGHDPKIREKTSKNKRSPHFS